MTDKSEETTPFKPIVETMLNGRKFKALYTVDHNPHQICNNNRDGTYTCTDCGLTKPYDDLNKNPCTAPQPLPCSACGLTPVCAGDCPGIAETLGDPLIYVAGFDESNPQ